MNVIIPSLLFLFLGSGCATVHPGQGGVVFRPYRHEERVEVLNPGRYWLGPAAQLTLYDTRWLSATEEIVAQTEDRVHVTVKVSLTYRAAQATLGSLDRTVGPTFYSTLVRPLLVKEIREHIAGLAYDVLGVQATMIEASVLADIRSSLTPVGVDLDVFSISDIDYPREIDEAIATRMTAMQTIRTQETQLELARREGELQAQRAKGLAEATLAAKDAELRVAERDAEIAAVRAQSAAKSADLQSRSLTKAYRQLRSIEAMGALAASPGTKVYFVPIGPDGVPVIWSEPQR